MCSTVPDEGFCQPATPVGAAYPFDEWPLTIDGHIMRSNGCLFGTSGTFYRAWSTFPSTRSVALIAVNYLWDISIYRFCGEFHYWCPDIDWLTGGKRDGP